MEQPPVVYAIVVPYGCTCAWVQRGLGVEPDDPQLPAGAVGTWWELVRTTPGCLVHGTRMIRGEPSNPP